ncbi:hypothetical protein DH2020_030083 [Rehmannia glutinosa]|uniref:SKP1-like protein n=1 Tax=Rehmannia glutinosa TaxID=99300 RepID=A0ABR0VMK8_REHGL
MATPNGNPDVADQNNHVGNPEKKPLTLITLRSSDGHIFSVPENAAVLSITLNNLVEDGCAGNIIPVDNVDGKTLSIVLAFLNAHAEGGPLSSSSDDSAKRKFRDDFLEDEKIGVLFDVVLAANYLNIASLLELVTQKIADRIKNKSEKCVRKLFGIENDFEPEEEEKIKREYSWCWEGIDSDDTVY